MRISFRYISPLLLAVSFATPAVIFAAPAPQEAQVRVYDRSHKDYHNWDDRENHAWGVFLTTNHRDAHEYAKSNRKEQSKYWNWRHSHPD
jgi:hypothetical protein